MARISTYIVDTAVTLLDRWIGTDSGSGDATKNFTAQSIADLFNEKSSIGILGQNNFQFQADLAGGRRSGTISFTGGGGGGTNFSALTTIKISKYASSTKYILDYLLTLEDEYVMIAQIDDLNNFGIYTLDTFTEDVTETDFYNATFTLHAANGSLTADKYYGIAIYPTPTSAAGDLHYTHTQDVASATWNVAHNLGKFPSTTVTLSTGQIGYGDVTYTDENNLTITFAGAETGKAYIN